MRCKYSLKIINVLILILGLSFESISQVPSGPCDCPYPIIFIHGWAGDGTTWKKIYDDDDFKQIWGSLNLPESADELSHVYNSVLNVNLETNIWGDDGTPDYDNCNQQPCYSDDDVIVHEQFSNTHIDVLENGCLYAINFKNWWSDGSGNQSPILLLNNSGSPTPTHSDSNESSAFKQGYALGKMINQVLEITGKEKVILVGHSMGGIAAREYLQRTDQNGNHIWWVDSTSQTGHKVAKLLTVGTPHRGSNTGNTAPIPGLIFLDFNSEAVRDLRYSYEILTIPSKGVYLYGGNESTIPLINNFASEDVDCDGEENSDVVGINSEGTIFGWNGTRDNQSMKLPINLKYTYYVSGGIVIPPYINESSDGIVLRDRQWLFEGGDGSLLDFLNGTSIPVPINNLHYLTSDKIATTGKWHTIIPPTETQDIKNVVRGLDEADYPVFAYKVDPNVWYSGIVQVREDKVPFNSIFNGHSFSNEDLKYIDGDWYKFTLDVSVPSISIELDKRPNTPVRIEFYENPPYLYSNENGSLLNGSGFSSNDLLTVDFRPSTGKVDAGTYYFRITHVLLGQNEPFDAWKQPYKFRVITNPPECGNGICEIGYGEYDNETYQNCPSDCDQEICNFSNEVVISEIKTSCSQYCDGEIEVNITNGIPVTFTWSGNVGNNVTNTATSSIATNLCEGFYELTITNSEGCSNELEFDFSSEYLSLVEPITSNTTCNEICDGVATISLNCEFSPPYLYEWEHESGQTGIEFTSQPSIEIPHLCIGNYSIQVSNVNGDVATTTFNVESDNYDLSIIEDFVEKPTCQNNCDGTLIVTAQGGVSPYLFFWEGGSINPFPVTQSSGSAGLCPGNHSITIQDDLGCRATATFHIGTTSDLDLKLYGTGNFPACFRNGVPLGNLTAEPSGGDPPYTFNWGNDGVLRDVPSGIYTAVVSDQDNCQVSRTIILGLIPSLCSFDPNEIVGPPGYGDGNWVSVNDRLDYTIHFENDPELASAPAQRVEIIHPFDDSVNPLSLRLGDFEFANMMFEVPDNSSYYSARLDALDSLGIYVDVTAGIDITENRAFWILQAIDPNTGLVPTDALTGVLPVNDTLTRRGEGSLTFTILPDGNASTGDTIFATANILFDQNDTIATNEVFNVIDAVAPNTTMDLLDSVHVSVDPIDLSWSGQDDPGGVGINFYDLYVSVNGGVFNLYQSGIDTNYFAFQGENNYEYAFYVRATDHVGNEEGPKYFGETETTIQRSIFITPKIFLQGPYDPDSTLMSDALRAEGHVPVSEPFTSLGFNLVNYATSDTLTAALLSLTGPNAIVDWVFLELRDQADSTIVRAARPALIQRDGEVVDLDGTSPVAFTGLTGDDYFLVVRHRNHLGVMTASPLSLSNLSSTFDFTTNANNSLGGTNGIAEITSGIYGLYAGDFDGNGQLQNTDVNALIQTIGNAGYLSGDLDMNGQVQNTDLQLLLIPSLGKGEQFPR
ncbi:MAG: alpha/beta fold hydrolase [Bacteroidota bacterium]